MGPDKKRLPLVIYDGLQRVEVDWIGNIHFSPENIRFAPIYPATCGTLLEDNGRDEAAVDETEFLAVLNNTDA